MRKGVDVAGTVAAAERIEAAPEGGSGDCANGSLLQSDYFFNCHRVSPHMYSIC